MHITRRQKSAVKCNTFNLKNNEKYTALVSLCTEKCIFLVYILDTFISNLS